MKFLLQFDEGVRCVRKVDSAEFLPPTSFLSQATYANRQLHLPDPAWHTLYLGAGEEKAVFCICDPQDRVFALELIDEKGYLNGRFVGGDYFFTLNVPTLRNVKLNPKSLLGLTFTGLVKAREFAYGYEWGCFQFDARKPSTLDGLLTTRLQFAHAAQMAEWRRRYKDVHERNVLFEIRDRSQSGVLTPIKDANGKLKLVRVGVQPIDVR